MHYLLGFAPWIVFWVFFERVPFAAVSGAACLVSLAVVLRDLARRNSSILDAGTLLFFLALAATSLTVTSPLLERWASAASCAALLAITLFSLAVGRPFTLQYARRSVPREFWGHPRFLAVNRDITWVWALAFAAQTASSIVFALGLGGKPVIWIVHPLALLGAAWFTVWYSARARRRGEEARKAAAANQAGS